MTTQLSTNDEARLIALETDLWRAETRFDRSFMDGVLAADFLEYGRSGRSYDREAILNTPAGPLLSRLPLREVGFRILSADVVQVTYISEVEYDGVLLKARRSSIWSRKSEDWELRFHQGTPLFEE